MLEPRHHGHHHRRARREHGAAVGAGAEVAHGRSRRGRRSGRAKRLGVGELVDAIEEWSSHWNDDPRPFVWTKPAADIITKVRRGRTTLTHQINSATDH